jgi:hypothetical protein
MRWLVLAGLLAAACTRTPPVRLACPAVADGGVTLAVSGVYRYASPVFALRGTISFAQQGDMVQVTGTSYDNAPRDRSVVGMAPLAGNRVDVRLVPQNGDTDYTANVSFVFTEGGRRFCVREFSDTNGDTGGDGSFFGLQVAGERD